MGSELDNLIGWAEENSRKFNARNVQVLSYQRPKLNKKLTRYTARQGIKIPEPKSVRDLSNDISDDTHFQNGWLAGWLDPENVQTRKKETVMVLRERGD